MGGSSEHFSGVVLPFPTKVCVTDRRSQPIIKSDLLRDILVFFSRIFGPTYPWFKIVENKALDLDGILNKVLLLAVERIPYLHTFTGWFKEGVFPVKWKLQKLVLVVSQIGSSDSERRDLLPMQSA